MQKYKFLQPLYFSVPAGSKKVRLRRIYLLIKLFKCLNHQTGLLNLKNQAQPTN